MATGTVLVLNTQDTADHKWSDFFPRQFVCTFTEDTSIAYLEIRDASHGVIQKLLNLVSDMVYDIKIDRPIAELFFVPDSLLTEKKLSITNITMDGVSILNSIRSAGLTSGYNIPSAFILTDGTTANAICYDDLTIINGVISVFSDLIVDSLMFYRVLLNGYVIGYVTGNTATAVTTSLVGYSDATPRTYCFQPNVGRMPLSFAALDEVVLSYSEHELASAALREYSAPPLPFATDASLTERLSNSAVTSFASSSKQRVGIRKDLL